MLAIFYPSSHPTRVRGLKRQQRFRVLQAGNVAPHAGAWIETDIEALMTYLAHVAPHAGAWIETTE